MNFGLTLIRPFGSILIASSSQTHPAQPLCSTPSFVVNEYDGHTVENVRNCLKVCVYWATTAPPAAVCANRVEVPPVPPPTATGTFRPAGVPAVTYSVFAPPVSLILSIEPAVMPVAAVSGSVVALISVFPDRVVAAPPETVSNMPSATNQFPMKSG